MKVIKLSKWAKLNDYSYRGAYNRFVRGDLPQAYKTETGGIVVPIEEDATKNIETIVYCRVSSNKQKQDLERQVERMTEFAIKNGWQIDKVIAEIASGLNDKRPKLQKILDNKSVYSRIVVEHKDRLTRFGFNYIESLLHGEIIIANQH